MLDGDDVRAALRPQPGYDDASRSHFYATLMNLAAMLASQGMAVLVPATANRRSFREAARELAPRFVEVFIDTPVEVCAERDAKGLYARAKDGDIADMPGVGASYERPEAPDVVARGGEDEGAVERIIALAVGS
jgi:adenylylsulfate kinase